MHYDTDPMSPAEWDTLGTMYACKRDAEYQGFRPHSETHGQALEALERRGVACMIRYLRLCYGVTAVPFDIYDHGTVTIREASEGDDNCSGYIAADAESIEMTGVLPEDVTKGLQSELGEWRALFDGEVVGYVVTCEGTHIDSCWGFYPDKSTPEDRDGLEYVREQAREAAQSEQAERLAALTVGVPTVAE